MPKVRYRGLLAASVVVTLQAAPADAAVRPQGNALLEKSFRQPELNVGEVHRPVDALPGLAPELLEGLSRLGAEADSGFFDPRSGRWSSLILSRPLVPGTGVGNDLRWQDLGQAGRPDGAALELAVWTALRSYLERHHSALRVNLAELGEPRIAAHEAGDLIQVHVPRVVAGIPVRDSSLTAVVNHGNLVLLGLRHWADVDLPAGGTSQEAAREVVATHVRPHSVAFPGRTHLELLPTLREGEYEFRLVWVVPSTVEGDPGSWEGLVDAASGELLAFEDTNHYASRRVVGGVFPVSNDGRPPDGQEQAGWPMPFANVTLGANPATTTTGGILGCTTAAVSTALNGQFVRINDACGAISESSAGDLDLGVSGGTDCEVPPGHSAGDTHAARTGFYELNRIKEQARALLPTNVWLQGNLQANMNINGQCGALWNSSAGTVNFYRDTGGPCRNPGEIASAVDHEWGHGMDANDLTGTISSPSEGVADVYAFLRLSASCIGRGLLKNQVCAGYGDGCIGTTATGCTGVRDIDYTQRRCNRPHTVTYITQGFTSDQCGGGAAAPACPGGSGTPCGRVPHCEGAVVGETAFDLARRDLTAPPFSFDSNTALELGTRMWYLGAQPVTSWYTCVAGCGPLGNCGCGASGGYLNVLAADDDNGNLNDGTPHMTAIRAAFERHEIHCATPAVVNSGCAGGPTTAPTVTATAVVDGVSLSWTTVPGASRFAVYRTEGVSGCDFGKVKIADVAGTSFSDAGLLSGRLYSYIVLPVGSNASCFGRASACAAATPLENACTGCPTITVSPTTIAAGTAGAAYSQTFTQTGGVAPIIWSVTGTLPAGLSLNSSTGVLSGTPSQIGSFPITVTAMDSNGCTGNRAYTLDIAAGGVFVPIALAVNTAGNSVFEPGETVIVAPSWRNDTGAPQEVTGTAGNFTGPAGSLYTVTDASASYGTVAAGATASCTASGNCYGLNISVPSPRPSLHWDSTVLETLSGSESKTWTLHVGNSFTDVATTSPFYRFIEILLHEGISGGCGPTTYCPASSTTREQMAVFVLVAKEGSSYSPPVCAPPNIFGDVPETSPYCRWIEELSNRGVVSGCGGGNYCPGDPVTREQMAVFVLRTLDPALDPPACSPPNIFADVPETSPFCRWIEELSNRGVVSGCGGGSYCPADPVTREQMGVFISVTFSLALYGV